MCPLDLIQSIMRRLDINVVGFVVFFIVSQYHNTELIHFVSLVINSLGLVTVNEHEEHH